MERTTIQMCPASAGVRWIFSGFIDGDHGRPLFCHPFFNRIPRCGPSSSGSPWNPWMMYFAFGNPLLRRKAALGIPRSLPDRHMVMIVGSLPRRLAFNAS